MIWGYHFWKHLKIYNYKSMIFQQQKTTGRKTPGSTQALEADHNDVVASMNSIILSFGLPNNAGVSCAFTNGVSCSKFCKMKM